MCRCHSGLGTISMKRIMARDKIIIYREWVELIREELKPDEQLKAYDTLFDFGLYDKEPTDLLFRAFTSLMRSKIKLNGEKYDRICERNKTNGAKGGRPPKTEETEKTQITQPNPNNPVGLIEPTKPEPHDVAPAMPEPETALEQQFEEFRRAYPGNKRGFAAEFGNFKKKYPKHWREYIPMLKPALTRLMEWRERATAAGQFVPNYKNLQTWLNQQCWTEELPEINMTKTTTQSKPTTPNYDSDDDFGGVKY